MSQIVCNGKIGALLSYISPICETASSKKGSIYIMLIIKERVVGLIHKLLRKYRTLSIYFKLVGKEPDAPVDKNYTKKALKQHNSYRRIHGSSPLSLDDDLSSGAEEWARKLAAKGKPKHSNGKGKYGENISIRCGDDDAVKAW